MADPQTPHPYVELVAALRADARMLRARRGSTVRPVRTNYDDAADAIESLVEQTAKWQATALNLASKLTRAEASDG